MKDNLWHISVLVPARDEEDLLPRCLRSLFEARDQLAAKATCDVIVVADRSTDATVRIAKSLLGDVGIAIEIEAGAVGTARATAATVALLRAKQSHSRIWLANTDADCRVPPNWLDDQLRMAKEGAEAVAGVVHVDSFDEHEPHVPDRFRSTYLMHPNGTHPHVHGANLGFRADAYLRAGGWANLETGEDHDLWARLRATGARTLSPSRLYVLTSGRRTGRAPMGFAAALAAHNEVTLDS